MVGQVVFLPGFGCLYVDVVYDRGTLTLSLAPEGSMETIINQHSRYECTGSCLCSLHEQHCALPLKVPTFVPFITFTSVSLTLIVNSSFHLLQIPEYEEAGISFTTGGQ